MRKASASLLALIAVLACSCSSQPHPPETAPDHPYLPQQMEVRHHSTWGGQSSLILENRYLVRKSYEAKKPRHGSEDFLAKTEYFVPTEEQWREFWTEMKRLRIWEWRKQYLPSDIGETVFDGGGWHLRMAYRGRAIDTSGVNAGPKRNSPETTAIIDGAWDHDLDTAISRLIGKQG